MIGGVVGAILSYRASARRLTNQVTVESVRFALALTAAAAAESSSPTGCSVSAPPGARIQPKPAASQKLRNTPQVAKSVLGGKAIHRESSASESSSARIRVTDSWSFGRSRVTVFHTTSRSISK